MEANCRTAKNLITLIDASREPVLVAIDGRSGVGKSTFAVALAAATQARLIEGDAFYAGGLSVRSDTPQERADLCIDRPKLRGVLEQLMRGKPATYRQFDWDAFDGRLAAPDVVVEPAKIIILEGVYSAHPDFADFLAMRILLTVSDEVRRQRLVAREGAIGPWERQWHEAEDWYFSHLATPDLFDLVIGS